jgi:nicotinamidase-related amidase
MSDCLILVDLQNDYFVGGTMELVDCDKAAANAQRLLTEFRKNNLPVVHVQHIAARPGATFFLPETHGAEIHDLVAPKEGERVVVKNFPNSFRDTALLDILQQSNITTLTICGAMSHMCIDATTRAAFDLGFNCVVAEDACATRDLVFKGQTIPAAEVHAAFMAALSVPYAKIEATEEIIQGMA